jgi:O-antigen/teichoic acid export membrane protein
MFSAMVGAFTGNLLPLASAYTVSGDASRAQAAYLLGTRVALTLALPPAVLFLAEGPALLTAWVGPGVGQPSGAILQLLVIAYFPSMLNSAGVPYALGMGLHRLVGVGLLSEGVIKVGLSLLWLGRLGTTGVALATLVASLTHQGLLWPWIIGRHLQVRPGAFWTQVLLPTLVPTLAMAGGLLLFRYVAPGQALAWRVLMAAITAAVCWAPAVVSLWRLRFFPRAGAPAQV